MEEQVSSARRIRQLAAERPDDLALRHIALDGGEPAFTWRELDRRSSQLAGALAERGLGFGEHLGLGLRNSPQFVLAVFAAWKLGAVPIPVRWDVPEWELGRLKEVIEPRVYLGGEDLAWIDSTERLDVPDLPDATSPQIHGICSSGSTGTPKVIVSDRPSVYVARMATPLAESWGPVPRPQTVLVLAPMYHANGLTTLYNLLGGDHLVVMEKFDAARVVDVIERHRITTFTATPTMLQRIADLPGVDGRDLSSIRWFTQGAAPMPPSLVHRWAGLVGAEKIHMVYGMTEGLGLTALRGDEWMEHQGSVGRGIRGTEVRILDADDKELPTGEIGEIYLRTPGSDTSSHYLGAAPKLHRTADGFQSAGDLGYLDGNGYLHLVDRRVDMIISGGANVFPAEVEAALIDHPKIADVVVIGLRDPEWGRRVHAVIEPADPAAPPTASEVISYAKSRLAPYKVPKTVELVDAIPRSEATKVNRGAMVAARDEAVPTANTGAAR
ncbi:MULTISPECIES: class I adenylate-forming enzyme family protein [unclassified Parafrankia]|uniref:class I adenylate-forming enzyme family protein n=1 Tax=unclassified Parafrankia TaxID=2994368 RepID=UPI000DA56028|nr:MULTISPECIES: AMP-binding protein [unclassified Parafrankia]TCJ32550.1 feruloyl-CoA synthetase [Parafrankia sp. BMG5.11]SQD97584.1 AMP-dependent synthetase and ligase [Parafrankia sp. Ea1.12]